MNAEEIYRNALEQMAADGNEAAKMVLTLGAAARTNSGSSTAEDARIRAICDHLNNADRELAKALGHNDLKWTRATDNAIEDAREELNKVRTLMITR